MTNETVSKAGESVETQILFVCFGEDKRNRKREPATSALVCGNWAKIAGKWCSTWRDTSGVND